MKERYKDIHEGLDFCYVVVDTSLVNESVKVELKGDSCVLHWANYQFEACCQKDQDNYKHFEGSCSQVDRKFLGELFGDFVPPDNYCMFLASKRYFDRPGKYFHPEPVELMMALIKTIKVDDYDVKFDHNVKLVELPSGLKGTRIIYSPRRSAVAIPSGLDHEV